MARETVNVRLDATTRRKLAAIARRRRRTPSALVRAAIDAWLATEGESDDGTTPFEAIADLVGCVHGGDPHRSRRRSTEIAETLRARRRTRRS
jgi:predicted transcriptional regulator